MTGVGRLAFDIGAAIKDYALPPAVGWGIRVGVLLSFRIEQRVQGVGYLVRQDVRSASTTLPHGSLPIYLRRLRETPQ